MDPFEGHALVPEAVVAWCGVAVWFGGGELAAREEAEDVEAVGWCYYYAFCAVG